MPRVFGAACLALLLLTGCGYHVAGKADLMPMTIHTIAISAFANKTVRYKLAERLPAELTREFISRTRYKIVADPNAADAILTGAVLNFTSYPTTVDPTSGRADAVQLSAFLQLTLTERATGKVLFTRASMEVRERYEISVYVGPYFDESGPALDRLSHDVARTVVSAILENF